MFLCVFRSRRSADITMLGDFGRIELFKPCFFDSGRIELFKSQVLKMFVASNRFFNENVVFYGYNCAGYSSYSSCTADNSEGRKSDLYCSISGYIIINV